ncbi:hypothetical protein BJ508DRAFT_350621 [Ascobolus immersus RN42]|uniref:Uncharacterized protein n=1 Tax=Ascobolus immersus RN42 TaxID=1160509 RepID=A0A3N4I6H1_ASCIM|nr:hypothetical protein BJ508DRAFT_350621 [Ascobolus immersus RN42]
MTASKRRVFSSMPCSAPRPASMSDPRGLYSKQHLVPLSSSFLPTPGSAFPLSTVDANSASYPRVCLDPGMSSNVTAPTPSMTGQANRLLVAPFFFCTVPACLVQIVAPVTAFPPRSQPRSVAQRPIANGELFVMDGFRFRKKPEYLTDVNTLRARAIPITSFNNCLMLVIHPRAITQPLLQHSKQT